MYRDKNKLRILKLQLQARNKNSMLIKIDGPLTRKRSKVSSEISQNIEQVLKDAVDKFQWKSSKRAKYAVKFHFFGSGNIPDIHNLVKFYLDLLRKIIFEDDRQVWYLSADCPRPEGLMIDECLYIEVQTISNFNKQFKLFFNLLNDDEFEDHIKDRSGYDGLFRKNFEDDEFEDYDDNLLTGLGLDEIAISRYQEMTRRLNMTSRQEKFLSLNSIEYNDHPGKKKEHEYSQIISALMENFMFHINLGSLPRKGEGGAYRQRICEEITKYQEHINYLDKIIVPVDLDVKISSQKTILGKDLDNIMRDIAPIFRDKVLSNESYINAYRIYFSTFSERDCILLKPLKQWTINNFDSFVENTCDDVEELITDRLYWG